MSDPTSGATPSPKPESWLEIVRTIAYALVIAFAIRTFAVQTFNIPTGSMEATLLVGDYVFVEKFAYGYGRASFPFGYPPFSWRIWERDPARGDVVVFKMPNPKSPEYGEDFIKRCIGLPGDRVQMIGGVLYLNDRPIPKVRAGDVVLTDSFGVSRRVSQFRETLPGGKSYLVLDQGQSPEDDTPAFVVPPGHYFMMGDNRDDSNDSREDVGYVPAENLVGRASFRFYSVDETAIWYEPWTWPGAIRFSRMFRSVDRS